MYCLRITCTYYLYRLAFVLVRDVGNTSVSTVAPSPSLGSALERLALAHIAILLLLMVVFLASTCMGAQYMHRYRKYQLAAANDDMDSLAISCKYELAAANDEVDFSYIVYIV